MRRRTLLTLAVSVIAACSSSSYPLPAGPPHAGQLNPTLVGRPVTAVVVYIQPRAGDRIELLAAAPVGVAEGASVRFLLSRPVVKPNGDRVIGESFEPLEGAEITGRNASPGPDDTVGIVAELTALRPGRYLLTNVRLRYRLNGREQVGEGIDVLWTVCADDPAPKDCPEIEDADSPA